VLVPRGAFWLQKRLPTGGTSSGTCADINCSPAANALRASQVEPAKPHFQVGQLLG